MQRSLALLIPLVLATAASAQELTVARISDRTVEIRLVPTGTTIEPSPMLVEFPREEQWRGPVPDAPASVAAGPLVVDIGREPLSLAVRHPASAAGAEGGLVQDLRFDGATGAMSFGIEKPVFGLGENGSKFDRRGANYPMVAKWGGGAQGSFLPSPFLIGADGWALFMPQPHGSFDLTGPRGTFAPAGAGQPLRCFVTAWDKPADVLAEYVRLTGRPALPPKWALGYMQSHRTLAGREEVLDVARQFRARQLPCDALIYLGTGYCPTGWNKDHGSVEFNLRAFDKPEEIIEALHAEHFKVVLHVNRAPGKLHGRSIDEPADGPHHIRTYWERHRAAFAAGADAWWPDDGDELPEAARLARHRCYFEGPLSDRPNERPWSLHRTGAAGMSRYGGWFWSGDVDSSWVALASHPPVGLAASLTVSPFWGSDIGGFHPTKEYSGELFVRWFQFAAFTPSFRSHGRMWHLHLPWGWNLGKMGPDEWRVKPDPAEFHNAAVEPACRAALNLRYQLLPYTYTLAREAHDTGMPLMRPLWLHHPDDEQAVPRSDEFLWGRDLLIAPVVAKAATSRRVYLPSGTWFDWWTGEQYAGGTSITRSVTLETIPIFVRAGAIIPFDPVRQYTGQAVEQPTEIRVYPGADGDFTLYDDDGHTMEYLKHDGERTRILWNDAACTLTIEPANAGGAEVRRTFSLRVMPGEETTSIEYRGAKMVVDLLAVCTAAARVQSPPVRPQTPARGR